MHTLIKTRLFCLFVILFFTLSPGLLAQEKDHDEDHNHDHQHKNEIGGSIGMVFDLNEQNTASGFHLHYTRMLSGKLKRIGFATGVECVFGDHKHYTAHLYLMFRPLDGWWLGAGPGYTYFSHEEEFTFSGHIETGYEFDAGSVHFGPVIEYAYAGEEQHIMVGLHLGVPF